MWRERSSSGSGGGGGGAVVHSRRSAAAVTQRLSQVWMFMMFLHVENKKQDVQQLEIYKQIRKHTEREEEEEEEVVLGSSFTGLCHKTLFIQVFSLKRCLCCILFLWVAEFLLQMWTFRVKSEFFLMFFWRNITIKLCHWSSGWLKSRSASFNNTDNVQVLISGDLQKEEEEEEVLLQGCFNLFISAPTVFKFWP